MSPKSKKPVCPTCGHFLNENHAKALKAEDQPEYVTVIGTVSQVRDKAVLVSCFALSGSAIEVWVPRSQIDAGGMIKEGVGQRLDIKTWFAQKEGMRYGD